MGLLRTLLNTDKTDTSSISFTAHYTGYVWYRNGLSSAPFRTRQGELYYALLWPFEAAARILIGGNIKDFLLQRHFLLDHLIEEAITQDGVTQILEIACGLSPRGWRFTEKFSHLTYIEADLPEMAQRKQHLLHKVGAPGKQHKVVTCNILSAGDDSLESVIAREFDTSKPLLVVTEGLVNYFNLETISGFWQRLQQQLQHFPSGRYLTDNYPLFDGHPFRRVMQLLGGTLGAASRSNVSFHFNSDEEMATHFRQLGFRDALSHNPRDHIERLKIPKTRGNSAVRILEART